MKLARYTGLAFVIAAFIAALVPGCVATPPAVPTVSLRDTFQVPAEGATFRLVDKDTQVDVLFEVPGGQKSGVLKFKFKPPKPLSALPNPTNVNVYRNLTGLVVTDVKDQFISQFEPPITITVKYLPSDLDRAKGNVNNLFLLHHDGKAWTKLSMASPNAEARTITARVSTFVSEDDEAIGGE